MNMSKAVQNRLNLTVGEVQSYLKISDDTDVELIDDLIDAVLQDIDTYLHNDFESVRPQIVVGNPDDGEFVNIDGTIYIVASTTSVEDKEFADADGLVSCINSAIVSVGIQYIEATNDTGTVTLKVDSGHIDNVDVRTSDGNELSVRRKVFEEEIPLNIKDGAMKQIAHRYYKRTDGLESQNAEHGGSGSLEWGKVKREYLQPYRRMNV